MNSFNSRENRPTENNNEPQKKSNTLLTIVCGVIALALFGWMVYSYVITEQEKQKKRAEELEELILNQTKNAK
ncbi:hypothetical protein HX017_09990 [Myroides marinus]|uniref:hypothetical protein n=1 Tax=Myroides marinus TaxID=703342 RepID=UPI002575387E|nr:hypothetical protein [Myroides marinus]MDM1347059.1 hypothetical protein [Myroides marinus]MDM1350578.1 hypothetical protein [Myroides marinus]MDM1354298.1 hypothetical protein [Myroides marinus]MDM1357785.1 hypothetical protein [Myroides marinus]MDM1362485.1 hypothetical protein [Myroides marinus]